MDERDSSTLTKTADTVHTGIFASVTRPFSPFLGRAWGQGYADYTTKNTIYTWKARACMGF